MAAAFDAGVNFFDNAEVYATGRAETIMGAVLKAAGLAAESTTSSRPSSIGGSTHGSVNTSTRSTAST